MKFKQITSTQLKQNTRRIIEEVRNEGLPYYVTTYAKPMAVVIDYATWEKIIADKKPNQIKKLKSQVHKHKNSNKDGKKLTRFNKIKHLVQSIPEMTDSVTFFRKQRDEEGL